MITLLQEFVIIHSLFYLSNIILKHHRGPMIHGSSQPRGASPFDGPHQAALTWDTMDRIRDYAGLPFYLKGIATAEDAKLAVDHGVDVIWVSNHGGRQLDQGQSTIEMLPEIVEAVDGKAQIVLDGGVVRGADVVKAIALGADAVAIGKLQGWGLGAGGKEGLLKTLEILEDEVLRVILAGPFCFAGLLFHGSKTVARSSSCLPSRRSAILAK